VISVDPPAKAQGYWRDHGLTFPVLYDDGSAVIRRYGVLNERTGVLPHPTALVIDRQGIVRYARTDEDYRIRPPASDLLAALRALKP